MSDFLRAERERRNAEFGDVAILTLSQVIEALRSLEIIIADYESANAVFLSSFDRQREAFPGGGDGPCEVTPQQDRVLRELGEADDVLQLRIETFYLFAKILLDKIALAVRGAFGPAVKLKMSKHSELEKNLRAYAEQKGLRPIPDSLARLIKQVSAEVAEFRDKYVTHNASPRTVKGTVFNRTTGESVIQVIRLLPQEGEVGVDSAAPPHLTETLNGYVEAVISYLTLNRDRAT